MLNQKDIDLFDQMIFEDVLAFGEIKNIRGIENCIKYVFDDFQRVSVYPYNIMRHRGSNFNMLKEYLMGLPFGSIEIDAYKSEPFEEGYNTFHRYYFDYYAMRLRVLFKKYGLIKRYE